jgi:nucleoside-diphosphate-sugar epimerase
MARYLVTGAAGFIASRVAELLLADGHHVVGVDNLNDAYDPRIKLWRLAQLQDHPRFEFHRLDISDHGALADLVRRSAFDAVLNLAARAGVRQSVQHPWVYLESNIVGTLNLLELCREQGIGKFVLASTSGLYGARNPVPFREDANTDHPLSPYAASKKGAEALAHAHHYLHSFDVTVFRYFSVYGPAGRPDMSLFRFVKWISEGLPVTIYGDGTQSRDFTYVDDIARGTIAALGLSGSPGEAGYRIMNLGSDQPVVLMDAVRLIEDLVGKRANLEYRTRHPADIHATWADISQAESLLGWRPQVRFEEGISRLVEWYRDNREWAKELKTG